MGTSQQKVRANDQHQPDDFDSDARQNEGGAGRAGREQDHRGENQPPTGEQKEKAEKLQECAPGARGRATCATFAR